MDIGHTQIKWWLAQKWAETNIQLNRECHNDFIDYAHSSLGTIYIDDTH